MKPHFTNTTNPIDFPKSKSMMNERIKLPAQEWLGYDPDKGDIHGYTFEQMREFAELIVRECADISDASFHNGSAGYTAILKHFGVEE